MFGALLADVDSLGGGPCEIEKTIVRKVIVEDDIGTLQSLTALEREQSRIARPGAYQIDFHPLKSLAPAFRRRSPKARPKPTGSSPIIESRTMRDPSGEATIDLR